MAKSIFLDFEFNKIVEPRVNLVCCATFDPETNKKKKWWLHNDKAGKAKLKTYLEQFDTIIAYSAVAECRSFISLGLDPLKFRWIDLFLEYRLLTNHNDGLQYGKQLVDGKVRSFKKPKPKWERTEEDNEAGFKATHSLAEATYKLTGEIRDTVEKTKMRDLIISDPKSFSVKEQEDILNYCLADVVFLPEIWTRTKEEINGLIEKCDMQRYFREAMWRGRYSAHTALMENRGYPIMLEETKNFSKQVGTITWDMQREICRLFPEIKPFRWNKREGRYSMDTKAIKGWISANHDANRWMHTDGGDLSLSLDAFQRFYDFKHQYPTDNFGAQMVRFAKLKQSLYGFSDSGGGRKTFWDNVGSDGRVRPYMNHYGAQSSRSQPGATGFMFLKPAWMRALVQPDPGRFIASIDYGQQEFFIAALRSGDQNMIEAYLSGDPYLFGAKLAGAIPPEGTKDSHKSVRDVFKNTYLGILFGMTKYGLAVKLTNDTGREWTEDEAQEQIDIFEDTFPIYMEWKSQVIDDYANGECIELPCGWIMWADNDNPRSVANVPVQGFGASVMRKAVDLAVTRYGIEILKTLHDALYFEGDVGNEKQIGQLKIAMRDAFIYYFDDKKTREFAAEIKMDPFAWSPDYKKDSTIVVDGWEIPISNLYIDDRSIADYEKFSQYFSSVENDIL